MRKLKILTIALVLGGGTLASVHASHAGEDDGASLTLSLLFPGVGEWYNAGFSGGFPLVECILGTICPCVRVASVIDAVSGKTDDGIRFDFWSSPS